jgi:tRNA pseudouridine55 synthase
MSSVDGALLIDKPEGMTSFAVIEALQRRITQPGAAKNARVPRRERVKMGHGGTLDPFATGLLIVCCGKAVKLARYFLGSSKEYEGVFRFGETTIPGDPTGEISERSEVIPTEDALREMALKLTKQPYLQTPPMHSAKKKDGKPLYELARQGIEIERDPKLCELETFEIRGFESPRAEFYLKCSSGTYVRTLAQDTARLLGTVALLEKLRRRASGSFRLENALELDKIETSLDAGTPVDELPCWVPFDRLLEGFAHAEATDEEARSLYFGRQNVLFNILRRSTSDAAAAGSHPDHIAIYHSNHLIAVAKRESEVWGLERVFPATGQ